MKRGLLFPTGNAECDLLSFVANRRLSATSPELPASEYTNVINSTTNAGFENCAWRPLTGPSLHKNTDRKTQQSRSQSAHEPRGKTCANLVYENQSTDDTRSSRQKLHFPTTVITRGVYLSIQEMRTQLHASKGPRILERTTRRTPNTEGITDAKLHGNLHLSLRSKEESPRRKQADTYTDNIGDKEEERKYAETRRPRAKTKKSKKNVRWKHSVVPLPAGSDFDNLIRSGVIAKHIAKKERKRRCW